MQAVVGLSAVYYCTSFRDRCSLTTLQVFFTKLVEFVILQFYFCRLCDLVKQENYTCIPYFLKTPISPMYNSSRDKKIHKLSLYIYSSLSQCFSLLLYLKHSPYLISDIDECSKNSHNCSYTTATCTNTNGSFKCICKPGFSGDGHNCTGTVHYLKHDNLSFHHNKTYATGRSRVIVYTNLLLLKTGWSYSAAKKLQQGQCHLYKHRGVVQLFL